MIAEEGRGEMNERNGLDASDLPQFEEPTPTMRTEFHDALDRIDDDFVSTALLVSEALPRLNQAFLAGDRDSVTEARDVARDVGSRCRSVEDHGFVLLAREAPVASDLRRLVALLRMCTDVDRSASLLAHVSESLLHFDPRTLPSEMHRQFEELAVRATEVFRQGVDAWRRKDGLAVNEVDALDESVDRLRDLILEEALAYRGGEELVVLGLVARYYERIADHGVALAQDATFVVTGERVEVGH